MTEYAMGVRDAVRDAANLYEAIYTRLRAKLDERQARVLDAMHADGVAKLTACSRFEDGDLGEDATTLVRAYLRGPAPGDDEAAETWMSLLPEIIEHVCEEAAASRWRVALTPDPIALWSRQVFALQVLGTYQLVYQDLWREHRWITPRSYRFRTARIAYGLRAHTGGGGNARVWTRQYAKAA